MRSAIFLGAALIAEAINPSMFSGGTDHIVVAFVLVAFAVMDIVDFTKNDKKPS